MLGEKLSQLRKNSNYTQDYLSKALKISRSALSQYEINKRQPDYETLVKIANFFDVSTDYLLGNEYSKSPEEIIKIIYGSKIQYLIKELQNFSDDEIDEVVKYISFIKYLNKNNPTTF